MVNGIARRPWAAGALALLAAAAAPAAARKEAFRMIDAKARLADATAGYVADAMSKLSDGRQLAVVASLGPRHIGKSSLLNQVFGAKFDDEAGAGVWISPASHNKDVLLLNAMAADSAESELTQKRLAALCSSVADCVVLNAWYTTSARPTTATVDILSTLFAEQLRQASEGAGVQRSLVLYALHGTDGDALSAQQLAELREQVAQTWEAVPKPAGLANAALSDYFDFKYIAVPPARAASEHKEALSKLRAQFAPPADAAAGSLLKPSYTKAIDVENFGVLAEQLWADACAEPDDGLAATREQLRMCYIASQALFAASAIADKALDKWSAQVARKRAVVAFGAQGRQLLSRTLAKYDEDTAACEPGSKFVAMQRAQLSGRIKTELARLFNDQVRMLNVEAMVKLRELLLLTVARQGSVQDWQVANMQTSVERWFTQKLAELVVPELALNLVPVKAELSARLAQYGSRFASSATVQVQALQYLAERAKEGRAPKGKAAMAVSYALTGAVRTAGSGNLQSFASYTTGPYSANFMLANDRDLPESAAATGQPPPTLRLQPKITFDIDL
ncbi:hypothetical protein KFE25_003408 [Diacronema lutheri]|uniref:Guanylate-binding protein N-terminal domain-containing protein n=1 Tax=Diacronema lutheri TaxID=2081491 RepID=A0A8J6CC34_DIALT|nr:hypothetical protein KFE25_003408 [Diacronema lutheri]